MAWCLALAWVTAASAATDPACARYAVRGIAPGMRPSEVRKAMGSRGSAETVRGLYGNQTGVSYPDGEVAVYVLYDRDASKNSDAQVVLVRIRSRVALADPKSFVRSIVGELGEPALGGEHLDDGFLHGSTVWAVAGCDVEIMAYRQQAAWWQPEQGGVCVQVQSAAFADAEAARTAAASTPPPGQSTPPAPQQRPPEELTPTLAAAAARPDSAEASRVAPAETVAPKSAGAPPEPAPASGGPPAEAASPAPAVAPPGSGPDSRAALAEAVPPSPAAAASDPAPSPPVPPSEDVTEPVRIPASYVPPRYPDFARKMKFRASVQLGVQVRSDGSVGDVRVLQTTRKALGFEQAAIDAVRQWRYQPATRGGKPEEAVVTVWIDFE